MGLIGKGWMFCRTLFVSFGGVSQLVQTFRLAARCSRSRHRRLSVVFGMCSELYNAVLESWRGTYLWWREHHPEGEALPRDRSQSHYDRLKMFTGVRGDDPGLGAFVCEGGEGCLCSFPPCRAVFLQQVPGGEEGGVSEVQVSVQVADRGDTRRVCFDGGGARHCEEPKWCVVAPVGEGPSPFEVP